MADALARWVGAAERHAAPALSPATRAFVEARLEGWVGERLPLSRSWVEEALEDRSGGGPDVARLALLVTKAAHQADDEVVTPVLEKKGETSLLKVLAWSGMTATRHLTELAAQRYA